MEANTHHPRIKRAYSINQTSLSQKFNQGPDKQRLHGQEDITMSEETKGNPVSWEEVNLDGNFVKFEDEVRTKLLIHKWGLYEREGKKYESEETEMKVFFDAEVLNHDGNTAIKTLSTSSVPFLRAIKPIVKGKDPKKPLHISVKKFGKGNKTTYDIELVE